jgi:nucleotide-binding universal stress UspA family protein
MMISLKKILVATDFSDGSQAAHSLAAKIAHHWGAKVDVLHIVPTMAYLNESVMTLGLPLDMETDIYPKLLDKAKFNAEAELVQHYEMENRGEVIVVTGRKASEEIANRANESYDMAVLGAQGEHRHIIFGGTAEHVVRHCTKPVLAVPTDYHGKPIHKILVPSDGSRLSLDVLPFAIQLAEAIKAEIQMLHVLELYGSIAEDVYIYQGETEIEAIREGIIEKIKDHFQERYEGAVEVKEINEKAVRIKWNADGEHFMKDMNIEITKSVSAQYEITDLTEGDIDMIAMATHGRSGIARILLGSTTEKVVRHSHAPVLTIRPEKMGGK